MGLAERAWEIAVSLGGAAVAQGMHALVQARGTILPAALATILPVAIASYVRSALRIASVTRREGRA